MGRPNCAAASGKKHKPIGKNISEPQPSGAVPVDVSLRVYFGVEIEWTAGRQLHESSRISGISQLSSLNVRLKAEHPVAELPVVTGMQTTFDAPVIIFPGGIES